VRILADENIPYVREAFGTLGVVVTMPGRAMDARAVRDADALLVRSVTKVSARLLEGSRVQFVATATIGEDHVDKDYLASRGIGFASAPGSNANSVAQYVVAALLELAERFTLPPGTTSLGIVGVGNVGTKVAAKASALGLACVLNDPPLARATGDPRYRPVDEIFACEIVTLHVPLTKDGPDHTYHLADEDFLRRMKPGAILINTSRGAVADGAALRRALDDGRLRACVLDVWEGEPSVDVGLLERVFIGTPHIAGYSFDGKVNGTRQIYEAACRHFGAAPDWDPTPLLPPPECPDVTVPGDTGDDIAAVRGAVRLVYDIRGDDTRMRAILDAAPEERPRLFDRLRKEYPRRREFFNTRARITPANAPLEAMVRGIGFRTGYETSR